MSLDQILAELGTLDAVALSQIRAKLDELAPESSVDGGLDVDLSESDRAALKEAISSYEKNPEAGRDWTDVRREIEANLSR